MGFYIIAIFGLAIGGTVGLILGKGIASLIRSLIRSADKARVQTAMMEESYFNNLYEECLYDEQDRLAKRAAREMSYYDR